MGRVLPVAVPAGKRGVSWYIHDGMVRLMQTDGGRSELEARLRALTREGLLYEKLADQKVRCVACGHRCLIAPGKAGVCRVRFNDGGLLRVPVGYAAGLQVDPIEKKPFYHALPGSEACSFGMLGCDFHCDYCQNWISSQTLRDEEAGAEAFGVTAEEIVALARRRGAQSVTSTYNEPLITSEWAVEVFRVARQAGLATSFVSNGHGTPEAVDYLRPWVDFYKVDLKTMNPAHYRQLGGRLEPVLSTIRLLYERGFWLEVLTLVVPRFNDSEGELRDIARFIKSLSADIPWHVTAFHSDYRMSDRPGTGARQVVRAAEIGREEGLRFVYAGNRPGGVSDWENTRCPGCNALLVERTGFTVLQNNLQSGRCPKCRMAIPGVWTMEDVEAARACGRRDVAKPDIKAMVEAAEKKFAAK
jgi:pyruvate formate lyase activating enzyme